MVRTKKKVLQKNLIVVGIALAVIGFSLHFSVPSTTRSGSPAWIEASNYMVDNLDFATGEREYIFKLYVKFYGFQNLSAYLLTPLEYEHYSTGTPLRDLDFIASFSNSIDSLWQTTLTNNLDMYLILFNNNTYDVICGYYYVIIPSTFFSTLTVGFMGVFLFLCGLGWYLIGWRRYFILGFTINLVLFFVRIFTLVNDRIGFPDLFGIPYVFDWFIEPYNDYQFFYLRWIPSLWEGAWPYTLDNSSPMVGYIYPPLWLYTIGILGSTPSWLPGLILFTFNMVTGIVVYNISHELTGDQKKSVFSMLLYLLNPFTFFYGSFMWLNPTPYVFFLTFSFWMILKRKGDFAIIAIAIATLYKQFTIIFLPLIILGLIIQNENTDFKRKVIWFVRYCVIYLIVVGGVSLPFILVDYTAFVNRVWFLGYSPESLATFHFQSSWPVNFITFFVWLGMPHVIALGIGYLLAYYILLGIPAILIYITFTRSKQFENIDSQEPRSPYWKYIEMLFWSIILVLLLQVFYPRGTYKFYLTILVPFISILFDYKDLNLSHNDPFSFRKHHLMSIVVSWAVFLCFRLVYFWILVAWILFYFKKADFTIDSSKKSRKTFVE